MRIAIVLSFLVLSAALPLSAWAGERCEHSADRALDLDLEGVKTVIFEIGQHTLSLKGGQTQAGAIRGKACASDAKRLADLVVTQDRKGDTLIVRAVRTDATYVESWVGNRYAYLKLEATLPETIPVRVNIGSGDALVDGVASLAADVGSGDLEARRIRGTVHAAVGSGDIVASDVGPLHVVSVGSGDLNASGIRGDTTVGSVHSGDLRIGNAGGRVRIDSIHSGDAKISGAAGDVSVEDIGSGSLQAIDVRGSLTVSRVGSGSVEHRGIAGQVRIPVDD